MKLYFVESIGKEDQVPASWNFLTIVHLRKGIFEPPLNSSVVSGTMSYYTENHWNFDFRNALNQRYSCYVVQICVFPCFLWWLPCWGSLGCCSISQPGHWNHFSTCSSSSSRWIESLSSAYARNVASPAHPSDRLSWTTEIRSFGKAERRWGNSVCRAIGIHWSCCEWCRSKGNCVRMPVAESRGAGWFGIPAAAPALADRWCWTDLLAVGYSVRF